MSGDLTELLIKGDLNLAQLVRLAGAISASRTLHAAERACYLLHIAARLEALAARGLCLRLIVPVAFEPKSSETEGANQRGG